MIPICREQGCRVHRTPGPKQQACVLACVLGFDDDRPKKRTQEPRQVTPQAPEEAEPAQVPVIIEEPPPAPLPKVASPPKKRKAPPRVRNLDVTHLGLGEFQSVLPQWRSRPLGDPPWERAPCGKLGHEMTRNLRLVTCKACRRSIAYKKRISD